MIQETVLVLVHIDRWIYDPTGPDMEDSGLVMVWSLTLQRSGGGPKASSSLGGSVMKGWSVMDCPGLIDLALSYVPLFQLELLNHPLQFPNDLFSHPNPK